MKARVVQTLYGLHAGNLEVLFGRSSKYTRHWRYKKTYEVTN